MKVKLEIFEGPLDLLLYLIKKNHINIYDIPISLVVEQYKKFLAFMKALDINIAGDYLVMLAELLKIKSKMLLFQKTQESEEEEEDPRKDLVKRLLEYEKFRKAANFLREKESTYVNLYRHSFDFPKEVYLEVSLFDLIKAFKSTFKDVPHKLFFEVVKDEFTIEEKMHDLLHLFVEKKMITLEELFSKAKNKLEIIVIFLALLELIRLREIVAFQKEPFGPIFISRRDYIYCYV